jgi:hypothetical protein
MPRPHNDDDAMAKVLRALEGQGTALSQLATTLADQQKAPPLASSLAPWIGIAVTIGSLIAGGSYFISQRPTIPIVQEIVAERQRPIVQAVEEQKSALKVVGEDLKGVGQELRKVRESQIRQETRREVETGHPSRPPSAE